MRTSTLSSQLRSDPSLRRSLENHQPRDIGTVTTHNSSLPLPLAALAFRSSSETSNAALPKGRRGGKSCRVSAFVRSTHCKSSAGGKMDSGLTLLLPPPAAPAQRRKEKAAIMVDGKVMKNTFSRWLLFFGWMIDDFLVSPPLESSGLSKGKLIFTWWSRCFSSCCGQTLRKPQPDSTVAELASTRSRVCWGWRWVGVLNPMQTHSTPIIRFNFIAFHCQPHDWLITHPTMDASLMIMPLHKVKPKVPLAGRRWKTFYLI